MTYNIAGLFNRIITGIQNGL